MPRRIPIFLLLQLLCFTSSLATAQGQLPPTGLELRYTESTATLPNPERGFYAPRMSHRMGELANLRKQNITLLLIEIDLKDFRDRDLSPEKLDEVRAAFAATREHGLKAIVRAAYGFTGRDYRIDPKNLDLIRTHIRQLGEVYTENREVLCGIQAGFLGPWGEWHGSNWGDPPSLEARRAVLFGLLDAVPDPITVHVRRPMFIRDLFANEPGGSTLTDANAYSGSRLARTGYHNDALLSLPTDMGTYAEAGWNRERELEWCDNHLRYTPFGGETVPPSAKTPVDQVIRELEQLHATYLNSAYHRGTLEAWRKAPYQNATAFDQIERRLGYRFVADRLRHTSPVHPGTTLQIELDIHNAGFASPHLPRPVSFLLQQGDTTYQVALPDADPRRWSPEAGTITLKTTIPIPADASLGPYRLALHLPDPAPGLRAKPTYAIRLANDSVTFDESTGENILTTNLEVQPKP